MITNTTTVKTETSEAVLRHAAELLGLSAQLHADPETAFNEHRAAARVAQIMRSAGFITETGCHSLPTAVEATFGSGGLRVAICAEYDALPGIGHACGHNVIAAAAVGAALALAEVADRLDLTVVLLGTPAEEDGGGKVLLLEAGAFDNIDFALMVHPTPGMDIDCTGSTSQGCDRFAVSYSGTASHAAAAPERGINAANAATIAQVAIGLLRQQLPDGVRINALVRSAGSAINVIPESSVLEVEVRAHSAETQVDVKRRVLLALEGAAVATGCTWSWQQSSPAYLPLRQHEEILQLWNANLRDTGRTLLRPPSGGGGGSTDMGNVSQTLPAIHPVIAITGATSMPHTAGFAAETCGPNADAAVLDAARSLAATVVDVATKQTLRRSLQAERTFRLTGSKEARPGSIP